MTDDRIVVSRKALEIAYSSGGTAMARYLREIIDTAEEFPPVDKADTEPAESAWITDLPPTVEEVGDKARCVVHVRTEPDSEFVETRYGENVRRLWQNYDRWCPIPPFPPPVKRLCWCGKEMYAAVRANGRWYITCSSGHSHGAGPDAPTEKLAEIGYDKMVGR